MEYPAVCAGPVSSVFWRKIRLHMMLRLVKIENLSGRCCHEEVLMTRVWIITAVLLLLVAGCDQTELYEDTGSLYTEQEMVELNPDKGVKRAGWAETTVFRLFGGEKEPSLSKQLKINNDALLSGSTEQIRVDAATVMLFSDEPAARQILTDVLAQAENSAARAAVCKALILTRTGDGPLEGKDDFIGPLFEILATAEDQTEVKLAAEAILIFSYEQISEQFEKLMAEQASVRAKINAADALKLQPDMRAIVKLMLLLEDENREVTVAAEQALHSLGIPVGKDTRTRKQITRELKRKGRDEFLRDWVIRQEAQLRELEAEAALWRQRYVSALGQIYDRITDDAAKGKFLAEYLTDSKAAMRLWALERVYQDRVGTASKLPAELGPVLIELISDPDRDVRLQTARVLSLMVQLNSSRKLLHQLEIETDDEVKIEFFVALGGACHYAFSPGSEFGIPDHIRKRTLGWAETFLTDENAKKAQKGAEVVRKLLEHDGLSSAEVDKYLGMLAERYESEKQKNGSGQLTAELLNAMAGLCAQSAYKSQAARRFSPLFEEALNSEDALVRQAAVDGLIYVDKARALEKFRVVLLNDSSPDVRKRLIALAGEVGTAEDLSWLIDKIGSGELSEPAWQAMLSIFRRGELAVFDQWLERLDHPGDGARVSQQQRVSFLEAAELKAIGEGGAQTLRLIRGRLAELYDKQGSFEKAAEYLGLLRETAVTEQEKRQIMASLLDVYLRWPRMELAAQLVHNSLLERDLGPESVMVKTIDGYISASLASSDPNALLTALSQSVPAERPMWTGQLGRWQESLRVTEKGVEQ